MDRTPALELLLARDLRATGLDPRTASRPSRSSELARVRRGAYAERAAWDGADVAERYRLFVLATVAGMRTPAPLSHESAAVLHGLPIIGRWPERVHVSAARRSGGRGSVHVVRHGTQAEPDVVVVDGVAVTSVTRTVLDMAATRSFASALASADHALSTGATDPEALLTELGRLRQVPGTRAARRVVELADGRSGSVGESLSRARMHELQLPVPVLQQEFHDAHGLAGRSDFWWPKIKAIGEFDGFIKYRRDGYAGTLDPSDVVWREKLREDRLRALVDRFARWTWADAYDPKRFARVMARIGVLPGRS